MYGETVVLQQNAGAAGRATRGRPDTATESNRSANAKSTFSRQVLVESVADYPWEAEPFLACV
jgi:hypothetical protein